MRVAVWSAARCRRIVWALLCAAATVLLLWYPQAVSNGVRQGLAVCGNLLIPSLFPFLVLSGFAVRCGTVGAIGCVLSPWMRRVFGLSGSAAVAMLLSLIGGYPSGANAVADLYEQGVIDREEGQRLRRCCVSAGPAFVIGGIGAGILGSAKVGLCLLAAHWIGFAAVVLCERGKPASTGKPVIAAPLGVAQALTASVHAATSSLLAMCGFVLLASAVLSLLDAMAVFEAVGEWWRCLAACVLEVSTGCVEAAGMGRLAPFMIGAALGFGGLSVHGQIAARTASLGATDSGFFRARLLHALVGGAVSAWMLRDWHPVGAPTAAVTFATAPQDTVLGLSGLTALMVMCVLFLCTLENRRSCA